VDSAGARGGTTYTVSQLGREVQDLLRDAFASVWVAGEVARHRPSAAGHQYFDLVEKGEGDRIVGTLAAVVWKGEWARLRPALERAGGKLAEGLALRCRVTLDFYPPGGRLQAQVREIDPSFTLGELERRRRETLELLAASGLLVPRIGGPSAYPYQPPGIWDGLVGYVYPTPEIVPADDHHRRTMYSFVKRNAPHPAMAAFDMPDRGTSVVRRQTSNTPLQALVLLNDPQYLEAYRVLASRVMKAETTRDGRITQMFRLATRRRPRPAEMAPMRVYYEAQRARYASDAAAAAALVGLGVTPVDRALDPAQLAALMNLTAAVMNTPDAYSLR